jgi:hypothetical protein
LDGLSTPQLHQKFEIGRQISRSFQVTALRKGSKNFVIDLPILCMDRAAKHDHGKLSYTGRRDCILHPGLPESSESPQNFHEGPMPAMKP